MNSFNELTNIIQNEIFAHTENDYFLIKLFNYLSKRKTLDIIKYNKKLKKRIDINITDYKKYSEKYSSIEIEIKPAKKKYGKFININKECEKFYHIYFNNSKEEIKRNYFNENEQIKIIKIIIDYQVKSFAYLFCYCRCIESINFKKFYRDNINNMVSMFNGCSSLKELNLSNFNTNKVTNMFLMFFECSSLISLICADNSIIKIYNK